MRSQNNHIAVRLKVVARNHRLAEMRKAKRLTKRDLAQRTGLSRGRLSDIELLRDMPTEYEKDFIARGLGTDPVWLFPAVLVRFLGGCREICLTGDDVSRLTKPVSMFGVETSI